MEKSFQTMKEEAQKMIGESKLGKENLTSFEVALIIALNAHKEQKRFNDEPYIVHPLNLVNLYRRLTCYIKDENVLHKYHIPYAGVEEVCLLHDVIEDSEFSLDDIKNIYEENNLGKYFKKYIEHSLKLITHIKKQDYFEYIQIVMQDEVSSLVKFLDMQDNSLLCTLSGNYMELDKSRLEKYITYSKIIDEYYQFTKKFNKLHNSLQFNDFHVEKFLR